MIKTQHPLSSRTAYEQPKVRVLTVTASCVFQASVTTKKANPDMEEESFDFDWQ